MHIVLLEPEIPQNAGNIARTCAVTNTVLHLIKPLGFSVEDKYLKRAGLDYWKLLDIRYYENFQDFLDKNPNAKIWMATTKAKHVYSDVTFGENDYLMFGKESAGIPEEILLQYPDTAIRIPMLDYMRSCLPTSGLTMLFAMLTNIIDETTELIYVGKGASALVRAAFQADSGSESVVLPGVVSRKKQLVSPLLASLEQDETDELQ